MTSKFTRTSRFFQTVCFAALISGGAIVGAEAQSASGGTSISDDVVVTAQRRSENVQDVPIAATVLRGEDLTSRGITNVQSLQTAAPALTIQPAGNGDALIVVRGVGNLQTSPTSSAGVAFYTDGVFLPAQRFAGDLLYDVQSVEVLRGPQGTLVGENSTGGAILLRSAQPSTEGISGYFQQIVGNYERLRSEGAINIPLSEQFALRAAFLIDKRDSFSDNLGSGQANVLATSNDEPGALDNQGIRLQLLFRPSDRFDATLRYDRYWEDNSGPALKPTGSAASDPFSATIQNDPFKIAYSAPQYFRMDGTRYALEFNYDIVPGLKLRSITSHSAVDVVDAADLDYGRAVQDVQMVRWYPLRTYTQEVNLISETDSPFQWVAGGFYMKVPRQPLKLTALQAFVPGTPPSPFININTNTERESKAVFGQANYDVTDALTLTLGARYSENEQRFSGVFSPLTPFGFVQIPVDNEASSDQVTYRAVADFKASEDINLYVSYSTGYKAGGANLAGTDPPYGPETNKVFEAGLKSFFFDRHMRLNVAAFSQDYEDLQVQGLSGGLPFTTNASKAKIEGFEAETVVTAGNFVFEGALTYLNARTTEAFVIPAGLVVSGTELPYTSDWSGNAAVEYRFQMGEASLTPRLQYVYLAPRWTSLIHGPLTRTDERGTLDFRLTYESEQGWQLEGFVTNLADEEYLVDIAAPGFGSPAFGLTYGAPQEFGARFSHRF